MNRLTPRSVEFYLLRSCERFGMRPDEFDALPYVDQVRLLAFDQLRREEEGGQGPAC